MNEIFCYFFQWRNECGYCKKQKQETNILFILSTDIRVGCSLSKIYVLENYI